MGSKGTPSASLASGNSFQRAIRKNGTDFKINVEQLDMVFSTPLFLFLFLPLVLLVYVLLPGIRSRNAWLAGGNVQSVYLFLIVK